MSTRETNENENGRDPQQPSRFALVPPSRPVAPPPKDDGDNGSFDKTLSRKFLDAKKIEADLEADFACRLPPPPPAALPSRKTPSQDFGRGR